MIAFNGEIGRKQVVDKGKSNHKKIWIIAGVSLILIVGALFTVIFLNTRPEKSEDKVLLPCGDQQSSDIMNRASAAQNPEFPEKLSELRQIREEILKLPDYEKNLYCLHIITSSYIYATDYENSKKYLDMFNARLEEDDVQELTRVNFFMSVNDLRKAVDFLRIQAESLDKTRMGIPRKQPDGTVLDE